MCRGPTGRRPRQKHFPEVFKYIRSERPDIVCLQEIESSPHGFLRKYHAFDCAGDDNLILTSKPVLSGGALEFRDFVPIKGARSGRACGGIWVDIKIYEKIVRVYCCHLRLRQVGITERLMFLEDIIARDLAGLLSCAAT